MSEAPHSERLISLDAFRGLTMALLVSLAATLYPARAATKITPVETLRYE